MGKSHILLVEDEPFLAKVVKESLEQKGYSCIIVNDGNKAYNLFMNTSFSLCIIDVMLPTTDGFTLVKQIRAYNTNVPVLFLTAKSTTEDLIEGYRSGGNDYLKKPFSLDELFLRVNELLMRRDKIDQRMDNDLVIGKFLFSPNKQSLLFQQNEEIKLSYRETQLLLMLYKAKNNLLERKQALITLWGDDSFFNTRTMDVFITKLRKHLKRDTSIEIINVRGFGYKLIC